MKTKNGEPKPAAQPFRPPNASDQGCPTPGHTPAIAPVGKILVPVDFSPCSIRALEYASALAAQMSARITVLHVVEPALHGAANYLAGCSPLDLDGQSLVEAGRERLNSVAPKHLGPRGGSELLVRMGHAPSEILDTAKALGADLIVIGTHGHTGLKHLLLGSTAERVLGHATCPVLTIRS